MARRHSRKQRADRGHPAAASRSQPQSLAVTLGEFLAEARKEQDPRLALKLFQTAREACRNLPAASADEGKTQTMSNVEARLYLEALFGTGCSLRRLDRREEAVEQFREVLRLDADDQLFARYWLAAAWMDLERHGEVKQLLERYEEPTAIWRYAQALLAFRLSGDSDEARRLLDEAYQLDADFVDYLLGEGQVDAARTIRFGRDRQETAHSTAALFLPAWRSTPGAASWARRVLRVPLGRPAVELPFPRDELRRLPRRNVNWQMGLRPLNQDTEAPPAGAEWLLGIADVEHQAMMHLTVLEQEPTPEAVWRELLSAFLQPMEDTAHRPAKLQVPRAEFCRAWESMLAELSVQCVFEGEPHPISEMLDGMAEYAKAQRLPPLSAGLDPGEFPQTDEVWQADFFHMPTMISNEEIGVEQPWSVIVLDKRSQFAVTTELISGDPTPELMGEYLVRTMAHPGPRDAMRPAVIELSDSDCFDFLKPMLDELGVACVLKDELPEFREFCDRLASTYGDGGKCALADGDGVSVEQMESFYQVAAGYFQRAPWKNVPGEIPIRIQSRDLPMGICYAIVLGRTGVTLGLALYRNWEEVVAMLQGLRDWNEVSGFSVLFDEVSIMAPRDLYLVDRNGWPIATPEAYPVILHLEPGQQPQPPNQRELEYIEHCLRVVPDFVAGGRKTKTYELATGAKRLKMRLSWTLARD